MRRAVLISFALVSRVRVTAARGLVIAFVTACGGTSSTVDAGWVDSGFSDAGSVADAGTDAGVLDGGFDAGTSDAGFDAGIADAGPPACSVDGAPGTCILTSDCAALSGFTSTPGHCSGPADIECCMPTPNVANNPPIPSGWKLMPQGDVTPDMTTWAVMILNDPTDYPLFSTTTMMFGTLNVLARVEWHSPDFQNMVVHRGVTLYEPQ